MSYFDPGQPCPSCGRTFRIRDDGMVRVHRALDATGYCDGSSCPPVKADEVFVADFGSAGGLTLTFQGVDFFSLDRHDRRYVASLLDRFDWQRA